MIQEATAHDRVFTAKAAKDLDLWTSTLQLLFDTDEVSEADMETWRAHARHTRQVVSDQILGRSHRGSPKPASGWGTCLGGTPSILHLGRAAMCSHLGESCKQSAGDNGSACTRRPSRCIPGCPIPTHVHTATGDHLHGGHPSQSSSTPRGSQLGHTSIHDPVICSSNSRAGLLQWVCSSFHCWEHSDVTACRQ